MLCNINNIECRLSELQQAQPLKNRLSLMDQTRTFAKQLSGAKSCFTPLTLYSLLIIPNNTNEATMPMLHMLTLLSSLRT
jgi:hypothetical protein